MTQALHVRMFRFPARPPDRKPDVNRIVCVVLRVLSLGRWPADDAASRATPPRAGRKVWRITEHQPEGTWVDADSAPPAAPRDTHGSQPMDSWATSSMDLLDGMQIVEHTDSRLPDELARPTLPSPPGGEPR